MTAAIIRTFGLMSLAAVAACAGGHVFDPYHDLDASFRVATLQGKGFAHALVVPRDQRPGPALWVFLEGDGLPWVDGGRRIAEDPSPRNAVGFALFRSSQVARAYLGRPCYFDHVHDAGCQPSLWTSARYGEAVIASMAAAIENLLGQTSANRVVLVGYSGGGTLAYLLAPRVPEVSAVVSISGNLDIDAWSKAHRYLPLSGSANPATEPALERRITQIVILAGRDSNVPRATLEAFIVQQQPQEVWTYDDYDHICCWKRNWPALLQRIRARLE